MARHKKYSDIEFEQIFNDVLKLVKSGHNIENAVHYLKMDRGTFYRRITQKQKLELQLYKTANAKYSSFKPLR